MANQGEGQSGVGQAAAAAVMGLGSLAGNLIDSYRNRKTAKWNTERTIAANKEAAELAYQRDIEKWNLQNEYNTPQAQMERFKQAGLNPHLIYGQGTPGNAQSYPQYQAPRYQYQYESGNFGAGIAQMLPMMMSIGTWLQDMRLKEQQYRTGEENLFTTDLKQSQLQQLMGYLNERNPRLLQELDNKLSLFPYQEAMSRTGMNAANAKLQEFLHEVNYRWQKGGEKDIKLDLLRKSLEASGFKNKLLEAQSSWSDLDITNPQGLMQMVLGSAMGFFGQQLRLSTSGKINQKTRPKKEVYRYGSDGKLRYRRRE